MKFVKQVHDLVDIAVDKGITNIVLRTQVDDAIHQAQMVVFRELVNDYIKTKNPVSRNYLLPFEVKSSITVTTGIGSLPSNFEHELELWATVTSIDYPVFIKEHGAFKKAILRYKFRENDPVAATPGTNIFARIYTDTTKKIEVYPTTTPLSLLYVRKPVKPVYGTTNPYQGQYIYSDGASTDI